jgi:hypothetical protein
MAVDQATIEKVMAELGRRGGEARARNLSPEERKQIAIKGSQAAAKARRKKAKQKRAKSA